MSRFIALALALALLTPGVLSVTTSASTLSLTAVSFNADPSTVFDNTPSTGADATAWGTGYTEAYFGPGADNTTVVTYALDDGSSLNKIIARVTNASLISNDTADTTLYAKKSDTTATITAVTATSKAVAVGLGSIAIAYSAASGVATTGYTTHQNVYLLIVNSAGTVVANTAIVSTAHTVCATASSTNGKFYTYLVNNVFYENSTYYVSYTTQENTLTIDSTPSCPTSGATLVETKASLQGWSVASTPVAKWTSPADFATSTTFASGTFQAQCGPSNYTNSTTFYCTAYSSATDASKAINAYPITVSSGAVGTATAIATNSDPTGQTIRYTVAGFVYGMYQQGILLNCQTYTTTGTVYANTLNLYNFTSGATSTTGATAGGIALTGYTTATSNGIFYGAGVQNGTGFILLTQYQSTAASTANDAQTPAVNTYQYATYNGSAIKQGDTVTLGTVAAAVSTGQANWFVDAYGALWFGGYSVGYTTVAAVQAGTVGEIYKGQVGKVILQLWSDAGSILASFFALLSVMIAALFAF